MAPREVVQPNSQIFIVHDHALSYILQPCRYPESTRNRHNVPDQMFVCSLSSQAVVACYILHHGTRSYVILSWCLMDHTESYTTIHMGTYCSLFCYTRSPRTSSRCPRSDIGLL